MIPSHVQFPTFYAATEIAEAARRFGYRVRRDAGGPRSLSAYVYCDDIKIRVANHPVGRTERQQPKVTYDVHVGHPRAGAITVTEAICKLRNAKRTIFMRTDSA